MIELLSGVGLETWILLGCSLTALILIYRWHSDETVKFDLKTIILDKDGNFSVYYVGQLLALFASTWVLIYQTRHGVLTEWVYTGYMIAWAGVGVAGKWMETKSETDK